MNINSFSSNINYSSTTGNGFSTSIGKDPDKQKSNLAPKGSTTLSLKNTGEEREQITRATIGNGTIIIAGNTQDENSEAIKDLNRDVNKSQEITRDQITGALDGSMTVDNRILFGFIEQNVYERDANGKVIKDADGNAVIKKNKDGSDMTTSGYKSIANDIKNLPQNTFTVLDQTAFAVVRAGNISRINYYGKRAFGDEKSENYIDDPDLPHREAAEAYGDYVDSPLIGGTVRTIGEIIQFFQYTGEDIYKRTTTGEGGKYQPYKWSKENGGVLDSFSDIMNVINGANGKYEKDTFPNGQTDVDKYNNQDYQKYKDNSNKWKSK